MASKSIQHIDEVINEFGVSDASSGVDETRLLIRLRFLALGLVSAFLGVLSFGSGDLELHAVLGVCAIVAACIVLSALSWLYLKSRGATSIFILCQFLMDVVLITAIVYTTGGPISPFLFLYLPLAMGASYMHSRLAGLAIGTLSVFLYCGLIVAMIRGWLPLLDGSTHVEAPNGGLILQLVGLLSALVLIAIATSFLSRKLKVTSAQVMYSKRQLQEFALKQKQLIDELPDALITTDLAHQIVSLNQPASAFLGLEPIKAEGKDIFEILESVNGTSKEIYKAKLKDEECEITVTKNNESKHFAVRARPILDDGGHCSGYVFILHDVTELRSVEEQLQAHERMAKLLARNNTVLESSDLVQTKINNFIGESSVMQQVFKLIGRVAHSNATVLVSGESGTGKELVAKAIHLGGSRSNSHFVPVNCGAIPENLIESELFGHKKGSFTGAYTDYQGLFKQADGGTLFLDEIGELPLHMQTKLLRAIQEKAIRHIGGDRDISIDARIIAASNKNLKKEVEAGHFREDLYYRLNVINIVIPPLRDRREDIPPLVNELLKNLVSDGQTPVVPPASMQLLMNYSYPGNVRELENILERAYVLGGEVVLPQHLPESVRNYKGNGLTPPPKEETQILVLDNIEFPVDLDDILAKLECRYLTAALKQTRGAKKRAADLLGINFRSFRYRLSKFELGEGD